MFWSRRVYCVMWTMLASPLAACVGDEPAVYEGPVYQAPLVGSACQTNTDCGADFRCIGLDDYPGWCSPQTCSQHSDCGIGPNGYQNLCYENNCFPGCQSDADCSDFGLICYSDRSCGTQSATPEYELQTGQYTLSNLVIATNDCMLQIGPTADADPNAVQVMQVVYEASQLSVGTVQDERSTPAWSPSSHAFGTGSFATGTTATLTLTTHATWADDTSFAGCGYDIERSTEVVLTGNNALSVAVTHREYNNNSQCDISIFPPGCMSTWSFDLAL